MLPTEKTAYETVSFETSHIEDFRVQEAQAQTIFAQVDENSQYWEQLMNNGPCYTFRCDRIIAIGGLLPQWEGRGLVWSVFASDLNRIDLINLTRATIRVLDDWQRDRQFIRLETTVYEPFIQGHKWARRLGFVSEGVMCQYRLDQDYRLYARVC